MCVSLLVLSLHLRGHHTCLSLTVVPELNSHTDFYFMYYMHSRLLNHARVNAVCSPKPFMGSYVLSVMSRDPVYHGVGVRGDRGEQRVEL